MLTKTHNVNTSLTHSLTVLTDRGEALRRRRPAAAAQRHRHLILVRLGRGGRKAQRRTLWSRWGATTDKVRNLERWLCVHICLLLCLLSWSLCFGFLLLILCCWFGFDLFWFFPLLVEPTGHTHVGRRNGGEKMLRAKGLIKAACLIWLNQQYNSISANYFIFTTSR